MGSVGAKNSVTGIARDNTVTIEENRQETFRIIRQISKATFKNVGNGNWSFDVEGVGGGQVLEETGSSRAMNMGYMPTQKAYSISAWGENYMTLGGREFFDTLNEAKKAIKDRIIASYERR